MEIQCKHCGHIETTNKDFFVKIIGGTMPVGGFWAWTSYLFAGTGFAMPIVISIITGGVAVLLYKDQIVTWLISKGYKCPNCGELDWTEYTEGNSDSLITKKVDDSEPFSVKTLSHQKGKDLVVMNDSQGSLETDNRNEISVFLEENVSELKADERYLRAKLTNNRLANSEIILEIFHDKFDKSDPLALEVYCNQIFIGKVEKFSNISQVNRFCFASDNTFKNIGIKWTGTEFKVFSFEDTQSVITSELIETDIGELRSKIRHYFTSYIESSYRVYYDTPLIEQLSSYPFLHLQIIELFEDTWDWNSLSSNNGPFWSTELIRRFESKWRWYYLSSNKGINWSIELIKEFEDRWDWESISKNESILITNEILEEFKDYLDWTKISQRKDIQWDSISIEDFSDYFNWLALSRNESFHWNLKKIEAWGHKIDTALPYYTINEPQWNKSVFDRLLTKSDGAWAYLSGNPNLPWTLELIEEFDWKWDFSELVENPKLPLSKELLLQYPELLDGRNWRKLSKNTVLTWTIDALEAFSNTLDWSGISLNSKFLWSIDSIKYFEDKWDWASLSRNSSLPWDKQLITHYADKWVWWELSRNPSLPWGSELLREYEDKWIWIQISMNNAIPWTIEMLDEFSDRLDWESISKSPFVYSNFEVLAKFEDRFKSQTKEKWAHLLPILKISDIVKLMNLFQKKRKDYMYDH